MLWILFEWLDFSEVLSCEVRGFALAGNVSRPREVVKPANWVLSAKIEFIRENRVEATQNQQWSLSKCYHLSHHQRKSTKRIDKEFRQSALSRQVGCWIFARKLPAIFFCAPTKSSEILRFNFPLSFRNQNPWRKSATISRDEFQELNFKQAKLAQEKERK